MLDAVKVLRFAPTPLTHPNAAAALGAPDAGPADLDSVCAQLATLALTCRPGLCAGLVRMSRETDTMMTRRLTMVSCGGILRSLR